jgi:hypothetical protein
MAGFSQSSTPARFDFDINKLGGWCSRMPTGRAMGAAPKPGLLPKKPGTTLCNLCRRERVSRRGREVDGDGGPLTYFAGEMNRATMFINNFVCQR